VFSRSHSDSLYVGTLGIVYPSRAPEFTPGFYGVRVILSLVFCVILLLLFVLIFLWPSHCLSTDVFFYCSFENFYTFCGLDEYIEVTTRWMFPTCCPEYG